jgi:rod shape-determining protein MreB
MANYWGRNPWRCEVAIDLGTAFARVATKKFALVTIPAALSPPLRHGVVADQQAVVSLLAPLLGRAKRLGLLRPRVVVGAPTDATDAERETLTAALQQSGAGSVAEPLAGVIGAGADILSPYAQMIVDVGDGVTDCAIVRAGEILESQASRVGCGSLRESVQDKLQSCWGHCLKVAEVERIIAAAGTGAARPTDANIQVSVEGYAAVPVQPLSVCPVALQAMIEPLVVEILGTATNLLKKLPPACSCEIIESGILLTGGGALLPGLRERLAEAASIQVITPAKPLDVVIEGLRGRLEHA